MKNIKTKLALGSAVAVISLGSVTALAASWVSASFNNVPRLGGKEVNWSAANSKESNDGKATFEPVTITASLGINFRIVNAYGEGRSSYAKLKKGDSKKVVSATGAKKYYYYPEASTMKLEPNHQKVKVKFSPDSK